MLRSLLNQRLGRYLIKAPLGRGGMAAVYRATDTILQRDIALKILYPQYSDDASLIERFKREAVTAASLEHPNIVPVYDVGEHDGMAFIAMKLLNGRSLQERLQEVGTLSLDELLTVLTAVAAALDYAHARGIIHRDIKPANIFLSQENEGVRPLLTDFGIAKQLDAPGLTTTGALIGTPDYMAPEQIAGRPVDARTDGYALGMLAFRCLTGRRAFEGSTQDVLLGHLYGQAPLLSTLNPALPPGLD
ncbi:MAG: serine/threonine-protein kinase, partial [Chloroflexales bacterium]